MRPYGAHPTMKDVATHAGVALKTVSRVVNNESGVSTATAARVNAAIDELGFRRNDSARLLRTGRTASIGLLLEDLADPFSAVLNRAVEDVARTRDCLLFTGSSAEDPAREREVALAFCARRVDGLVIVPTGTDHRYLLPELAAGTAVVFADRPPERIEADAVLSDNAGGARQGVAHLIRHGHRRIGFIGDLPRIHTAAHRLLGYRQAMAAAALPVHDSWVTGGPTSPDNVAATVDRLLDGPQPVTALFTGNNRITANALLHLHRIDRHPALVGFDDLELAALLSPALTVVAQDPAALGRAACTQLFRRLDGRDGPPVHLELPTSLITRGSGETPPP